MQKSALFTTMLTAWVGVACGGVYIAPQSPVVDGRLDDACWRNVEWLSGFQAKLSATKKTIRNQTAFAIVSDRKNIYIGLKCAESAVASAQKEPLGSLWTMNQINVFLAPSGNGFNFYQFAFSANHGLKASYAYSEGGNILSEPNYLPEWEVKTAWNETGWTAEVRIPVNAFYFTRTDEWKPTWLVNVGRVRTVDGEVEQSSWSPVRDAFREVDKFRPFDGFPPRDWRNDVALTDIQFVPSGISDGRIAGVVSANLHLRAGGNFKLTTTASEDPLEFSQKGDRVVRIPAAFDKNGTYTIGLKLVRTNSKDGKAWPLDYRREARVRVDFRPIDVRFTRPAYRGNFYPGQDASEVAGVITTAADGEAAIEIEGPGVAHQKRNLRTRRGAAEEFSFATPDFAEGTATVTVTVGSERWTFHVRKLAKSAHRASWVEEGHLVIDGKPIVSRRIAHPGYRGGKWLAEIFRNDDMHDTTEFVGERGIEFGRLVPGSEAREGTKDKEPSKEVLDAIEKRIDKLKDDDFAFWYVCDEPECRGISPVYLKHIYDFIAARDPYHVVRIGTRAPVRYLDCCDWFETHPYINPQNLPDGRRVYGRPINTVGDFVSAVADLKRPDKVIGFYTTAFAYTGSNPCSDYPTLAEYITHAWAGIIRGARTVIPYAYHDIGDRASILEGTRLLFHQLEVLSPFIIADRRTVVKKTPEVEIVKYASGADTLTVSVDFKQLKVTLDVTGDYAARLPSYEETAARVDRLEHERTHTGSLLFGKWQKTTFKKTGSAKKKGPLMPYKLVDGIRNVLGCVLRSSAENCLEVGLSELKPTFSKAAVWGDMKTAKLVVKTDGVWQNPVEGVRDGNWCFRFTLPSPVQPEAVKLLFNRGTVELYEFELFE